MIRVAFGWLIAASAIALLFPSHLRAAERPPNIVFFLVDDLGWRDRGLLREQLLRDSQY